MNPELAQLMQQMGPQMQAQQGASPIASLPRPPGMTGGAPMGPGGGMGPGAPPQPQNAGGGLPWPMSPQGGGPQGQETMMAALAGIGFLKALEEMRKFAKAQNTVGMRLDKQSQVAPGTPGTGPADIQARAAAMGQQNIPGQPGAGGPGAPPGMAGGVGQMAMARMLAQPGQQGMAMMG